MFGGFGSRRPFTGTFYCHSVSLLAAEQQRDPAVLEYSDKIILPPSCLEKLAHLEITYPMIFEIVNPNYVQRRLHCGVLEFIAQEGMVYLPYWMMENMHLNEGDIVHMRSASIQKGRFVKLQPQTTDFIKISNPKAVLEQSLRNFAALTKGETFRILYNKKKYDIGVVEVRGESGSFAPDAAQAVCIIEADVEVDFEAPADYVEPPRSSPPSASPQLSASSPLQKSPITKPLGAPNLDADSSEDESSGPKPFQGSGFRLDGKPIKAPKSNAARGDSLLNPDSNVNVGIRIGPQGNVVASPQTSGQSLGPGQPLGAGQPRLAPAPKPFSGSAIPAGQPIGGGDSKPGDYWAKFEGSGNKLR
ncbi:hypothetical protein AB1Y20_009766 [Prymnesium parvum]|mmetsp:Transcript_19890/g.47655  ORF Transcript_19890/g.47655 Transcript_19890/m.47655 type:complete len:360 (+) Transcript_19890:53-1132(+)